VEEEEEFWSMMRVLASLVKTLEKAMEEVVVKVAPVSKELSWCTMNEIQNNWGLKNSFLNYWEIDFDNMIR